jgi:hypothetical protein
MAERLSDPKIQAFLGTKDVVVLATIRADGTPLLTPMWFLPGPESVVMVSVAAAAKVRNLRRDGRVAVVAEAGTRGDIRWVGLEGRAAILPDGAERRALVERLLDRYHPDLERRWGGRAMPPDRVLFRIVPETVRTWGLT